MSGSGPIYEYQREVTARLEQALRERDEARANYAHDRAEWDKAAERMETLMRGLVKSRDDARAEVERLRVQVEAHEIRHRLAASEIRGLLSKLSDALHEGYKAQAEAVSAFRRGAEAMREAAASRFDCKNDPFDCNCTDQDVADAVRKLALPKDKP